MDTVTPLISETLWLHLGGGALAGLAVGYTLKRASRLVLILVGLLIFLLYGLMKWGVISVHWGVLSNSLEAGGKSVGNWMIGMVKELSASMVGFGGGVVLGLKLR